MQSGEQKLDRVWPAQVSCAHGPGTCQRCWTEGPRGRWEAGPGSLHEWPGWVAAHGAKVGPRVGAVLGQPGWHWGGAAVLGPLSREVILETSSSPSTST